MHVYFVYSPTVNWSFILHIWPYCWLTAVGTMNWHILKGTTKIQTYKPLHLHEYIQVMFLINYYFFKYSLRIGEKSM